MSHCRFLTLAVLLSVGGFSVTRAQDCYLSDDFNSGDLGLWQPSDPSVMTLDGSVMRLDIAGDEAVTAWGILDPCIYTDFELSVDARSVSPTTAKIVVFHISGPTSDFDGYGVNIRATPWNDIVLIRRRAPFQNVVLAQIPYPSQSDTWYRMKVNMQGARIQIWVDEVQVLDLVDPDPLLEGWVALAVNAGGIGHAVVEFDNFSITPLSQAIGGGRESWGAVKALYGDR